MPPAVIVALQLFTGCCRAALDSNGRHPAVLISRSGVQEEGPRGPYRACTLCPMARIVNVRVTVRNYYLHILMCLADPDSDMGLGYLPFCLGVINREAALESLLLAVFLFFFSRASVSCYHRQRRNFGGQFVCFCGGQ